MSSALNTTLLPADQLAALLDMSRTFTTVQSGTQLLRAIIEQAQPLFNFHDVGLFVYDEQQSYLEDWATKYADLATSESNRRMYESSAVNVPFTRKTDVVIEEMLTALEQAGQPIIVDLKELFSQYPSFPQSKTMLELGYRDSLVGLLRIGGETLGFFCVNVLKKDFFQAEQFPLFQAVCDQIAIAVNNVLSNKRIREERRYKESLLTISQAVATIQDRKQLFRVILEQIKPVFPFDQVGLFARNTQQEGYTFLIDQEVYPEAIFRNQASESDTEREAVTALVEQMMQHEHPVITTPEEIQDAHPNFPHAAPLIEAGNRYLIIGTLKVGGQPLGIISFSSRSVPFLPTHFSFFRAITDQLSVAVNNVLANEERRQREEVKTLEVALVNALNQGTNREEKMRHVAQTLQPVVPFDLVVFSLSEKDPENLGYAFERIGHDEYRTLLPEAALRMSGLSREKYMELLTTHRYDHSLVANAADFEALCRKDGLRAVAAQTFRVRSTLIVPLRLSRGGRTKRSFQIAFYSRKSEGYTLAHRMLMEKIQSSLTLAIERQMAFEEVAYLNEQLTQEKAYLEEEIKVQHNFGQIIGESPAIQTVFEQIRQVADTDSTVLISGETGTGKELVARAVHEASSRRSKALVKINCAALPPQLLESELFGHEKGAFTGAVDRRIGKFEMADRGTIFLDEIGELPLELQSKLLRVLQEREFERVGGNQVLKADVRIVTATNRDLKQEVVNGTFRSDLYYRLHVFPIALPALRDRPEDIPLLATYFVDKCARKTGKKVTGLTSASLRQMQQYAWPGNIREMEHLLERSVILTQQPELDITLDASAMPLSGSDSEAGSAPSRVGQTLQDAERELIYNTLLHCEGRIRGKGGAAQMLDINPSTLEARMRKLGIQRKRVVERINNQDNI